MPTVTNYLRTASTALRMLILFTAVLGVGYPLAVTAIAQLPGLRSRADGSVLRQDGRVIGSGQLGQSFSDSKGNPLPQYFQPRPSAAGDGYDPTASSASNLGPESIVDVLADPSAPGSGRPSLLSQVCTRSLAIGKRYGIDGNRPFCSSDGTGSVLALFWSGPGYQGHLTRVVSVNQGPGAMPFLPSYQGVQVELASFGTDYSAAQLVPIRGTAPARSAVPADAVTASGSGLDPDISPGYAKLQEALVARTRNITLAQVAALVTKYTTGRPLGFMGEPAVNVLQLNLALDRQFPVPAR